MASTPVSSYAAQVWPNIPRKVYDNISIAHPLFFKLYNEKKEWESGTQYQPVVLFQSDTEGGMIDPTTTSTSLPTTQAQRTEGIVFNLKAHRNPYSLTLDEKTKAGMGELARITLMESKIIQATNRHVEIGSAEMFTGNINGSSTDVWGLDQAISTADLTPFVGQIDQSVDTWWAPQTTTASTVMNSLGQLQVAIENVKDGADKPNLIATGTTLFPRFVELMGQTGVNVKIDNKKTAYNVGEMEVQECELIKDKGCTAAAVYVLNTNYIEMWFSKMYDFWCSGFTMPFGGVYDSGFILSSWFIAYTQRRRLGGYNNATL